MNIKISILLLITAALFTVFLAGCPTDPGTPGEEDPTLEPTAIETEAPTLAPGETEEPTLEPTDTPEPTPDPTDIPTEVPTEAPTSVPTETPAATNIVYDLNTAPGSEWTTGSSNCDWYRGTVSSPVAYPSDNIYTTDYPEGSTCYGTVLNDIYNNDRTYANNYVQLGPLDLSGFATASGFRITFKMWLFVEQDADYAQIQYSTNGTSFSAITSAYVSGYAYTETSNEWSPNRFGNTLQWQTVTVDLGAMGLNGQSTVYFRWVLKSDVSITYPGMYIDDIDIGY